ARQRVLLPLQNVLRVLVDPDADLRKREVDPRLALEQQLVRGVRAQLLFALVGRIVFIGESRLVEVGPARVRAADALALGAAFPLADARIVEPQVLVEAKVALPRRGLRLDEQDHELLVGRTPVVLGLVDDVDLVLFLLFDVRAGAPVAVVLLAIVDNLQDVAHLRRGEGGGGAPGDGRRDGEAGEQRCDERSRAGGLFHGWVHPKWDIATTGRRRAARSDG